MPGIPLDAMDKVKAFFNKRKKSTVEGAGTAGTNTAPPTGVSVPEPTPTTSATGPSSSDPTAPPAGAAPVAAPVDAPKDTPTGPEPGAVPTTTSDVTPGNAQK